MRIAYVESPERMRLVPELLAGLLDQYLQQGDRRRPPASWRSGS